MFTYLGEHAGKLVSSLVIEMMMVKLSIIIEHDYVLADANSKGQSDITLAVPADRSLSAAGFERLTIVKIFSTTISAIQDRVAQANHP